jgi:hypothetical protein
MERIVEHQPELAGIRTRAVELEGEGPERDRMVLTSGAERLAEAISPP